MVELLRVICHQRDGHALSVLFLERVKEYGKNTQARHIAQIFISHSSHNQPFVTKYIEIRIFRWSILTYAYVRQTIEMSAVDNAKLFNAYERHRSCIINEDIR